MKYLRCCRTDVHQYYQKQVLMCHETYINKRTSTLFFQPEYRTSHRETSEKLLQKKQVQERSLRQEHRSNSELLADLGQRIFIAIQKEGTEHFIQIIKNAKNVKELPNEYKSLIKLTVIQFAFYLYQTLNRGKDAHQNLTRLKRLYHLTPFTPLSLLLKISNPLRVLKGIFELFLARPFGSKSLLQRMLTLSFSDELKEIQKKCEELEKQINNTMLTKKIENFVTSSTSPEIDSNDTPRAALTKILALPHIEPKLDVATLHLLRESQIRQLMLLLNLYFQRRNKELLSTFLGSEQFATTLKDIVGILYNPLLEIYQKVDLSNLVRTFSSLMKNIIKVAEDNRHNIKPRTVVHKYAEVVKEHQEPLYSFLRNLLTQENSVVREMIEWTIEFVEFLRVGNQRQPLNLWTLLEVLESNNSKSNNKIDTKFIKEEIELLKAYREHQHKLKREQFLDSRPETDEDSSDSDEESITIERKLTTYQNDSHSTIDKRRAPSLKVIPQLLEHFVPLLTESLASIFNSVERKREPPLFSSLLPLSTNRPQNESSS
jgi:uncharacterized UPF0146 family protein